MPLETGSEQPEAPQEEMDRCKETAKNALSMAGFEIGELVTVPALRSSQQRGWRIREASLFSMNGRIVPGVILHNPQSYQSITIPLHELCVENPKVEHRTNISIELTQNKIVYLTKKRWNGEERIIMGNITNGPIRVSKRIESSLGPSMDPVEWIVYENGLYIIKIENIDAIYIFNPAESIDKFDTD